ncbi:unnamed protein product [Oncorhynchus mykiss]|uniref:Uncharacterized protein n=1 Tax=Oncorhynchus mykiss TaxID=8022 RepID=A0A060VW24_ONCMY|nr:unnamed protein product [Oncorhynchus mykiss]
MGKTGSKVLRETSLDGVQPQQPAPAAAIEGLTKTKKMKVKWTQLGMVFFLLLSLVMTGCFLWQYQLPKLLPAVVDEVNQNHSGLIQVATERQYPALEQRKCLTGLHYQQTTVLSLNLLKDSNSDSRLSHCLQSLQESIQLKLEFYIHLGWGH